MEHYYFKTDICESLKQMIMEVAIWVANYIARHYYLNVSPMKCL